MPAGLEELCLYDAVKRGKEVTEDVLRLLAERLPGLRKLVLKSRECSLNLSGTGLEGMVAQQGMRRLELLCLEGAPSAVTNRAVAALATLPSLRHLQLYACEGVSAAALTAEQGLPLSRHIVVVSDDDADGEGGGAGYSYHYSPPAPFTSAEPQPPLRILVGRDRRGSWFCRRLSI